MEKPPVSSGPSHPSGSNPRRADKGKAPLVEEEQDDGEEDEMLLQRKRKASAPPTSNDNLELAPDEGITLFLGQLTFN